jgi:hypothetical protein
MYSPNKQVGVIDPVTGLPAQQMTNVPPAGSSLVNPFPPQAQANAQGIYGGVDQRQNSVGAPLMFTDEDKNDDGFSSTAGLTAQKKYNDQLRSQKSSGETFSRVSGKIQKIEKSPQFTYTVKEGKIKKTK